MPKLLFTKIKWSENIEAASKSTQILGHNVNSTKTWLIKNTDKNIPIVSLKYISFPQACGTKSNQKVLTF